MKVKALKPLFIKGVGRVKVGTIVEIEDKSIEALLKTKAIEKIKDK